MLYRNHLISGLINALYHEKESITPDRTDMESDFRAGDISANFVISIESRL